eukprot:gb/GECG01015188.1/.p1 GENE.gb/GECG01015188.1/~~gb/GECG01015188.1/.p1  ORF type:complete len:116 (+),score=9.95 gb/GECG01015188.1/:1-348(+)
MPRKASVIQTSNVVESKGVKEDSVRPINNKRFLSFPIVNMLELVIFACNIVYELSLDQRRHVHVALWALIVGCSGLRSIKNAEERVHRAYSVTFQQMLQPNIYPDETYEKVKDTM